MSRDARIVLRTRERLLLFTHDKDGLRFRQLLTLALTIVGSTGILVTFRALNREPAVTVTNDAPIACLDSYTYAKTYSFSLYGCCRGDRDAGVPQLIWDALIQPPHDLVTEGHLQVGPE